ncbi:MAG: nucleoside recognition domain-containing protein [Gammaproteobacteria bacterium]
MLNYIWAGLIILSIWFALAQDIRDELGNTYGNGNIQIVSYVIDKHSTSLRLKHPDKSINLPLSSDQLPDILKVPVTHSLPEHWQLIARHQQIDKPILNIRIIRHDIDKQQLQLLLPEVHWVKLRAIIDAAFDMSKFAVQLAIGLAGIMALWLGLMKIAEQSGLVYLFVKAIHPLLHWLFPDLPKNHPALGSIGLNLSANILGLGNAATPIIYHKRKRHH